MGTKIILDYDIPHDAWYFDSNGAKVMPFCVLLEAALQPCGWPASRRISVPETGCRSEIWIERGPCIEMSLLFLLKSCKHLKRQSPSRAFQSADMIIESFDVQCAIGRCHLRSENGVRILPRCRTEKSSWLPVGTELQAPSLNRQCLQSRFDCCSRVVLLVLSSWQILCCV